ncbi:MAG: glycosyltransferase [Thiohalospira sp.]
MRIVHVVENLERGGLERMVIDLATAQRAQGHQVAIATLFQPGQLAPEAEAAGVAVHPCHKRPGPDPAALRRLRRTFRAWRPEVIHSHNPVPHQYAVLAAPARRAGRINTRHGLGQAADSRRSRRLYRLAMMRTDFAVAVCRAALEQYIHDGLIPPRKGRVIHNGIRVDRFTARDAGRRDALRAELGAAPGGPVVGTVGRLNPAKDQGRLVAAFAGVRQRHPDALLAIVGGGPLEADLRRDITTAGLEDWVFLLGDRDDVPALLAALDLFVLPSRTEGYSIALLEAAAAHLPAVVTRVGGNADIVADGLRGRVVPPGDTAALTTAMGELLAAPELRRSMGQNAGEWAREHASVAAMAGSYEALYREAGAG